MMSSTSISNAGGGGSGSSSGSSSSRISADTSPTSQGSFLTGTCGWSDETLLRCGRFYSSSTKSSLERLSFYARLFPCVEVDTSTYAIPSKAQASSWCDATPAGFIFHVKAFGLLPSRSCPFNAIPRDIRETYDLSSLLKDKNDTNVTVFLNQLPPLCIAAVWSRFNDFVEVFHRAKKLGCVVFQFQTSLEPGQAAINYVEECRSRLGSAYPMAVEFRSRAWYSLKPPKAILNFKKEATKKEEEKEEGEGKERISVDDVRPPFTTQLEATLDALTRLSIINIASDDLGCEFGASEPPQPMMPDGRLLVADYITSSSMGIIRLHRRKGDKRILGSSVLRELSCRVHRLAASIGGKEAYEASLFRELQNERFTDELVKKSYSSLSSYHAQNTPKITGPIYFLCGTDFEDQPIDNMRALINSVESFKKAFEGAALSSSSSSSLASISSSVFAPKIATPFDWQGFVKKSSAKTGILKFFSPAVAGKKREREEEEEKEG